MADLKRMKILDALRKGGDHHRYNGWRTLGMSVSLGVLLIFPLTGAIRIDLWRGEHRLFFAAASFREALAAVLVAFAVIYTVTFLSNVLAGRMFCGWGCPVGQLSRFGEAVERRGLTRLGRLAAQLKGGAFSFALVLASIAWWTDLRVLWLGTPRQAGIAWGIVAGLTGLAYAHGRGWRWAFCRTTCPIGLYYSFVAPAAWYGVTFPHADACIECNLCDNVCPVDLEPRQLMEPVPSRGGISIADAPGRNHCLECGDCVRACEWIIGKRGGKTIPLRLGFHDAGKERDGISTVIGRA